MNAKILKTEEEYEVALAYVDTLMNAEPGSEQEEELELFAMLIEQYEQAFYPIDPPDPVDAILFRMDQEGLARKDLVPYIGSQSKVSEVLNRKRMLSLAMIRRLHQGLQIPADVLLQEPGKQLTAPVYNAEDFPLGEMMKCNYFEDWHGNQRAAKEYAEELLTKLYAVFQGVIPQPIYCRKMEGAVNVHALTAWQARSLALIREETLPAYGSDALSNSFFKKLVRASYFGDGPQLARKLLNERGIHFVLLPHLSRTYLDGACFLSPSGQPVIGMTLRHDRLDNFWFTLAHELGHLQLHLRDADNAFFDDIEHSSSESCNVREEEANAFAQEMLIPADWWARRGGDLLAFAEDTEVLASAEELEISPAILAGRIRWASGDYSRHKQLVGQGEVRKIFAPAA